MKKLIPFADTFLSVINFQKVQNNWNYKKSKSIITKRIAVLFLIVLFSCLGNISAQNYYRLNGNDMILDNGKVIRNIKLSQDSIYSYKFSIDEKEKNFIGKSREFSFFLNDKNIDGFSGWKLLSTKEIKDDHSGKGLSIKIKGTKEWNNITLELNYLLYPDLALVRKWINIINTGKNEVKIEALNVEDLETKLSDTHSVVYENYGRMKHLGRFVGNWDDPVVVVHDASARRGIALGNEAPGVVKRTAFHTKDRNVEIGLTHPGQSYPFRKWLKPSESWESPKTFISLYKNSDNGFEEINNTINEFVVKYMQPRIIKLKDKPGFVYNTWYPFRSSVNDSLIRKVAKAASECGIQEFIIDDGWQVNENSKPNDSGWGHNYGDWLVDKNKFPNGIKPVFDYIHSLGMKPGLWISVATATGDSKVFKEHPEWFTVNKFNKHGNLHTATPNQVYTACLATGWFDYIKNKILKYVNDYGLAYVKLDLSVVASAYVNDDNISGCYALNHPFHKDHNESFLAIYERLSKLIDELHEQAPGLFVDYTFETAGRLQLMDYAIAEHAEGNWLSNFEDSFPLGELRVRQMAWWRSPALPASSLVIGNLSMDRKNFDFSLKSLIGTLPIVLGDPRKLSAEERVGLKKWSLWMQEMQKKYNYMNYRKDLPGFGEPQEGAYDGWMRINFENKTGGIFGIFRQGALEDSRQVFLDDLIPDSNYVIKLAPDGQEVYKATGKEIMEKGFQVKMDSLYQGKIFEVGPE
ncbi:MAG: alpha-galactosidase [Bacteroidota bacterium]|nr:alpha-galactosidase [Bacteroidota bacterium]